VLYREPMWLKYKEKIAAQKWHEVSVLYREPMWLKCSKLSASVKRADVSVLYREPMWLKLLVYRSSTGSVALFQCSTVSRCG